MQNLKAFLRQCRLGVFTYISSWLYRRLVFPIVNWRRPHLDELSIHIVDHCNLDCKGCGVLAPLAEKWFYDVAQIERDLLELAKKVQFAQIVLIGGETLLHPKLTELVQIVKRIYPKASVVITTNGILLPKMSDDFWKVCRQYKVLLFLTVYPPFREKLDGYLESAKRKGVCLMTLGSVDRWMIMRYSFSRNKYSLNAVFRECENKRCRQLYHSKLYLCSACFFQHYNRYFNENHETVKGYDIYKYSGKELQSFLNKPIPFCRFCHHAVHRKSFPWEVSKRRAEEWM